MQIRKPANASYLPLTTRRRGTPSRGALLCAAALALTAPASPAAYANDTPNSGAVFQGRSESVIHTAQSSAATSVAVPAANRHAGGYKVCPSGQYVNVFVTYWGDLTIAYWSGSGSPAGPGNAAPRYLHYGNTWRGAQAYAPTNRREASWSADATGTIVSARAYCDG